MEAKAWLDKNQQLKSEQEAAMKAKERAEQAELELKAEKMKLQKEREERQQLELLENDKTQAKLQMTKKL